jgi:hypothetical protein
MSVAITGTRGRERPLPPLLPIQETIIADALGELEPTTLIVGGAGGVDTVAARIGRQLGHHIHLVVPTAYYDHESHRYCDDLEVAPIGVNPAHSYKLRDIRMVELGSSVLAFPKTGIEEVRSGTWMTIRLARKANKPLTIRPLDGSPLLRIVK